MIDLTIGEQAVHLSKAPTVGIRYSPDDKNPLIECGVEPRGLSGVLCSNDSKSSTARAEAMYETPGLVTVHC